MRGPAERIWICSGLYATMRRHPFGQQSGGKKRQREDIVKTDRITQKRKTRVLSAIVVIAGLLLVFFWRLDSSREIARDPYYPSEPAAIYLYGEYHGKQEYLENEFEIWKSHYEQDGMRDLFIEAEYYTAQMLNIWLHKPDDEILDVIYRNNEGTLSHTEAQLDFYRKIKAECPETVFHGTDTGHIRETGAWYLDYLEAHGMEDSREYELTLENMAQGDRYYADGELDNSYRENCMVENFIRAYDALNGAAIMGIYGDAHADPSDPSTDNGTHRMAFQLRDHYGDIIQYESIVTLTRLTAADG